MHESATYTTDLPVLVEVRDDETIVTVLVGEMVLWGAVVDSDDAAEDPEQTRADADRAHGHLLTGAVHLVLRYTP